MYTGQITTVVIVGAVKTSNAYYYTEKNLTLAICILMNSPIWFGSHLVWYNDPMTAHDCKFLGVI